MIYTLARLFLISTALSVPLPVAAQMPDAKAPYSTIEVTSTGDQFKSWTPKMHNGSKVLVSPAISAPAGGELNHHRITAVFEGSGKLEVTVAHHGSD
ncbi:MAG: hypothetical protein ACOCZE_10455, partial [Planctomycetota bacterium]